MAKNGQNCQKWPKLLLTSVVPKNLMYHRISCHWHKKILDHLKNQFYLKKYKNSWKIYEKLVKNDQKKKLVFTDVVLKTYLVIEFLEISKKNISSFRE